MTRLNLIITIFVLFVFDDMCHSKTYGAYQTDGFEPVSLIALIANPSKFHARKILTVGYLRFEFEAQGLFLSRDDGKILVTKNATWLEVNEKSLDAKVMRALSGKWVRIIGVVNAKDNGHMGMYSLAIENISGVNTFDR